MASWIDGAEYAPAERPDGFAMPRTDPLPQAMVSPSPAAGQPVEPPGSFRDAPDRRPLASLVPRSGPARDPRAAFDVGTALAGTATAVLDPRQPIVTSSTDLFAPADDTRWPSAPLSPDQWAPPAEGSMVTSDAPPAPGVAAARQQVVALVSVPVIVALVVGVLISPMALTMLFLVICLGIIRRDDFGLLLRRTASVSAACAIALPFLGVWQDDHIAVLGTIARLGCGISLVVLLVSAWRRLNPSQ